jgi:signal transduction histidine kinase
VPVTRLFLRYTAGVALGGVSACAELCFLVLVLPALLLPAARARVFALARLLAEFERRRIARYLGQENAADYTGRRAVQYLSLRWLVGGLGAGVLILIGLGASTVLFLTWQVVSGGSLGDSGDPRGEAWYDVAGFILLSALLAFITLQGFLGVSNLDRRLARHFLGPTPQELLRRRVSELTLSRAEVVEAINDERRRIERDLHDGVQQRLVALGMLLGRAGRTTDPAKVTELLAQAHQEAGRTLQDLRDVTWRIYPTALDSGGLQVALESLAESAGVPVRLDYRLAERHPSAIETPAWFVACEAVTNAVKHASPTLVTIEVTHEPPPAPGAQPARLVTVRVTDDGAGGADPAGTGLTGLAQRVGAVDGTFEVHSPPGGPTVVTAGLPCASCA